MDAGAFSFYQGAAYPMRPRSTCLDLIAGNSEGFTWDDVLADLRLTETFDLLSGMALISRLGAIYEALYGEGDRRPTLIWGALQTIAPEAIRRGIDPQGIDLDLHFMQWFVQLDGDTDYSRAASSKAVLLLQTAVLSALAEPGAVELPEPYVRDLRLIWALTTKVLEQRGIDPGPRDRPWMPNRTPRPQPPAQ
jgi:hypothetical protein